MIPCEFLFWVVINGGYTRRFDQYPGEQILIKHERQAQAKVAIHTVTYRFSELGLRWISRIVCTPLTSRLVCFIFRRAHFCWRPDAYMASSGSAIGGWLSNVLCRLIYEYALSDVMLKIRWFQWIVLNVITPSCNFWACTPKCTPTTLKIKICCKHLKYVSKTKPRFWTHVYILGWNKQNYQKLKHGIKTMLFFIKHWDWAKYKYCVYFPQN